MNCQLLALDNRESLRVLIRAAQELGKTVVTVLEAIKTDYRTLKHIRWEF